MDQITLDRIKTAHPNLVNELEAIYKEICDSLKGKAICRFSSVLRTHKEQEGLYALGRSKAGKIVTNARPGFSYHNYGMAVDIVLLLDNNNDSRHESASWDISKDFDKDGEDDWMECVRIFRKYGWEWGGGWRFKDYPHFQKTLGISIQEAKRRYDSKEFIPGTKYIKL